MTTSQVAPTKISLGTAVAILMALIALIFIALPGRNPATPAAVDADPSSFSAGRALIQLNKIAAKPHPIGSAEQAEVRTRLVNSLTEIGLAPQVQSGVSADDSEGYAAVGMVHNIVARLPGTAHGKPLMLAAHYDSVPNGPGASDDGASVAAILETLRALKQGPALKNDVIVLFTDGEEAGLLGSKFFMAEHPWAKDLGLVLNFEYRGSSGRVMMFESSPGNGKLINGLASAAPGTVSNSLMYEIYRLLPNDTDMTSFKKGHMPGMNFAAIEQPTTYHMSLDSIEALDKSTLQEEGNIMLALVREFGNTPLENLQGADVVYFDLPGLGLVHYPAAWALLLTGLVVLASVAAFWIGVKNGRIRIGRTLGAAFVFLGLTLVIAIVCQLIWLAVAAVHPLFRHMFFPYYSQWYLPGFVCFVVAALVLAQSRLQRWFTAAEQGMGATLFIVVLLLLATATLPGVSFLFAWPLLPALCAQAYLFSGRSAHVTSDKAAWLWFIPAVVVVVLGVPVVQLVYLGCTPHLSAAVGLVTCLLLGMTLPLLALLKDSLRLHWLALAGACVFFALGAAHPQFDVAHPQPDVLFYALDGNAGKSYWISRDAELDSWNKPFFAAETQQRTLPEIFGASPRKYWAAAAPAYAQLQAPEIEVVRDGAVGGNRELAIRVRSSRKAPAMTVKVEGVEVTKSTVHGHAYSTSAKEKWMVDAYGMGDEWLEIDLQVKAGVPFQLRAQDETYGFGELGVALRPAGFVSAMAGSSTDSVRTVTVKAFR